MSDKDEFDRLLAENPLDLLKNRSLFNEFLQGFKSEENPYGAKSQNHGERFLSYRYRLYNNLALDEEKIARAQLAVIVSEVSILSLEAFTRASFDFSEFYKKAPPETLSAEDLQAVLEGDAAHTTAALNNHFSLPDDADYQLRLQGKLAIANLAAKFGFLVATSAAGTNGSRRLYDHMFSSSFSVADGLIMKSASLFGAYVYEDDFRKLLMDEAAQFAKDIPSYMLSDEMGFQERDGRIKQRFQQMRQDNFIERVRKSRSRETTEDVYKGADEGDDKKRAVEEERIIIRDVECNEEVAIPDLGGTLQGNQEALSAGKAIMDYLCNLQIGGVSERQEIGAAGGSEQSDDDEEEQIGEEVESSLEYDVFVDNNKRRMKKAEVQAAVSHGQQVAFLSAKQMQKFNQATNNVYAKNVSIYNPSRKEAIELESTQRGQQQQQPQQQQRRERTRTKRKGWFGLGRGKEEEEQGKDKSREERKEKRREEKEIRQERREERRQNRGELRDRRYGVIKKQQNEIDQHFDEMEEKLAKERADKQKSQKNRNIGAEQKKLSGILKNYLHDMKDANEVQKHESSTSKAEREKQKSTEIKR